MIEQLSLLLDLIPISFSLDFWCAPAVSCQDCVSTLLSTTVPFSSTLV
jgi:hypothetical protein